ncbi:MAG: hypothetical protein M1279_00985, partial [Candidatus Marsarchaeota archaeon]|nr:hypothetical protein [Candidatus Marsarchaeota archaeon]
MATNIIDYAYSEASKRSDGFAEAYAEEYASMGAAIEQGKFNGIFSSSGSGIRVRIMSKGNLYSMSTNLIDKQSVKSMVSRARGLPGRKVGMSDEPAVKGKDIVKRKKEPDIDGIKDAILKIDNYLQDKRVKYRSVYINFSYTKSAFMNDCG